MRVALVTTWDKACGIAEHSAMLKAAVEQADPGIEMVPVTDLHPAMLQIPGGQIDLVWLNYHAALHSQWTPEWIQRCQSAGLKVGVTYHDTGVPNSDQAKGICAAADAFVVHEPYDDLEGNGRYWRMGVPDWAAGAYLHNDWAGDRPILGTVGFPFPWKNYDQLARVTRANGWALLLLAPTATAADVQLWEALNPWTLVETTFLSQIEVQTRLIGCDATAFCYTCANTGQSGAVCQGIAARKPVIAFESCRQFRALRADELGSQMIWWLTTFDEVGMLLKRLPIQRVDPGIVALAEQDSWRGLGAKYATLFHELVG